jgi:hypothetical protein
MRLITLPSWRNLLHAKVLKMAKYPHLLPADCFLWDLWLAQNGGAFSEFQYDVKVGEGTDPGEGFTDNIRYDAIRLSQRRIDAVGYQAKTITLFEITTNAGLTALGQCLAYPKLFRDTYSPDRQVMMHLVTYQFQSDIERVFIEHGIGYTIIERPQAAPLSEVTP